MSCLSTNLYAFGLDLLNVGTTNVEENVAAPVNNGTSNSLSLAAIGDRITAQRCRLIDEQGRTVILRGANVGQKGNNYLPLHDAAAIKKLVTATGINFVRMYISWRRLEPKPLEFCDEYAEQVAKSVQLFNEAGVYVLIDMHQDVWGAPFSGSGAPEWAALGVNEPQTPMTKGLPWQAQYLDRRVYLSFNHFWNNSSSPEIQIPLQQHYAMAFELVAKKLAENKMVLGYDLMNEPFMGEEIEFALDELVEAMAPKFEDSLLNAGKDAILGNSDYAKTLSYKMVTYFQEANHFDEAFKPFARATAAFEKRLEAFYKGVGTAIRKHDKNSMLFLEPMALAGVGMPTYLENPGLENIAYAPHLYDCFMDSDLPYDNNPKRVLNALNKHLETAKRLNAPLVIGEWGNLPNQEEEREKVSNFAQTVGEAIDKSFCGAAYWDHHPGKEKKASFRLGFRPYARRVAGKISKMTFDWDKGEFHLTYQAAGNVKAPTVVALPVVNLSGDLALSVESAKGGARYEITENPRLLLLWANDEEVEVTISKSENTL